MQRGVSSVEVVSCSATLLRRTDNSVSLERIPSPQTMSSLRGNLLDLVEVDPLPCLDDAFGWQLGDVPDAVEAIFGVKAKEDAVDGDGVKLDAKLLRLVDASTNAESDDVSEGRHLAGPAEDGTGVLPLSVVWPVQL